jgi:hypothetical protein
MKTRFVNINKKVVNNYINIPYSIIPAKFLNNKDKNKNIYYLENFTFSRYLWKNTINHICSLSNENYILGPVYTNNELQIAMSGSVQYTEQNLDGLIREMSEELGVIPRDIKDVNFINNQQNKNQLMSLYSIHIKNTKPFDENKIDESFGYDNKKNKVNGIIYGDIKDVLSIFDKIECNKPDKGENIIGVCAIPVSLIKYLNNNYDQWFVPNHYI